MGAPESFEVEIVYADDERSVVVPVSVAVGTTVRQAVERAEIERALPPGIRGAGYGAFGRRLDPDHVLEPGDRIEILRDLLVDPKEARRRRASVQRARGPRAD